MEEEKSLLQQIRDKEEEVSKKIGSVQAETDAIIASAGKEADLIIRNAEAEGRASADELFRREKGKIQADIAKINDDAAAAAGTARAMGERNMNTAVDKIVRHVTM